jgi:hypothetical protein
MISSVYGEQSIKKIAIIGGGIAGCTSAILLAKEGHDVYLFEKHDELLQGGPWCHVHRGGFLYPMLSIDECKMLKNHSDDFMELFRDCIENRPTIIAYKSNSSFDPLDLIEKCKLIGIDYELCYKFFDDTTESKYVQTFRNLLNDSNYIKYPFACVDEPSVNMEMANNKMKKLLHLYNVSVHLNSNWDDSNKNNYDYVIYATGSGNTSQGFLDCRTPPIRMFSRNCHYWR